MATFEILNKHLGVVQIAVSPEDVDLFEDTLDALGRQHRPPSWQLAGGKGKLGKYVKNSKLGYLHRVIAHRMGLVLASTGGGLSGLSVDHINGDKMDNRRENLRMLSRQEQMKNVNDGLRVTNKSGVRGVSYIRSRAHLPTPWYASVMVDGKTKSLGRHSSKEDAAKARKNWDDLHP